MAPAISLRREEPEIKVLSIDERGRLLDACDRLRDRFFLTLLGESGIRAGEALGLRHEDVDARLHCIHVRPRHNANGARVKGQRSRVVDVSSGLMRLYADYMHEEYGDLDSDYVFVNLWRGSTGRPLRRWAVDDLLARLARRTGIAAHAHMYRHTHATELLRSGVAIEAVSKRLGHADVAVTSRTYSHLLPEDIRAAIDRATFSRSS
jgi:integrase/recombinase XerD